VSEVAKLPSELSRTLLKAAAKIAELEDEHATAVQEAERLRDTVARLEDRVHDLEFQLVDAAVDGDVYELISDVRRGIIDLDELYDRTVG
jgi:septal ring factor EnvC (AmiA/AmiB activator)